MSATHHSRRDMIAKAAAAGTLVWTAPVVLSSKVSATVGTVESGDGTPTVNGTPGVTIANFSFAGGSGPINVFSSSSFSCLLEPGNWSSQQGTGITQYRFDVIQGPATLTNGALPAGQWHTAPGQGSLALTLSFAGEPNTAYVIRVQLRYACCYPSTSGPAWTCWTSTASFTTGGDNVTGLVVTGTDGSANCNTAVPTC